ncbi:cell division protein FtsQ/DivIB [Aquifex sp.]
MRGVWGLLLLTILALYLLSFMVIKLPFFDIKEYSVIGIREDEKPTLQAYLYSLGKRIIFMPEKIIYENINKKFGNRFIEIDIRREFTREGMIINLEFKRRKPVAVVRLKEEVFLLDENGVFFKDNIGKNLPVIKVKDRDEMKLLGKKITKLARFGDEILIFEDKIVLKKGKVKYILPNIKLISEREIKVLKYALAQNFKAKVIDLRYKKFILLR